MGLIELADHPRVAVRAKASSKNGNFKAKGRIVDKVFAEKY